MSEKRLRVHALFESDDGITPFGASQIRILRPLLHPSNSDSIELTFDVKLPDKQLDAVFIDRLWRHDIDIYSQLEAQQRLLSTLAYRDIPFIYSLDDNLLDLNENPGSRAWPGAIQKLICRRFIQGASAVVVSTDAIRNRIGRLNENIVVLPNQIDDTLIDRDIAVKRTTRNSDKITFGYMGTFTHLDDLISVAGPLRNILGQHERLEFQVVGVGNPADIYSLFAKRKPTLVEVPGDQVQYTRFLRWMQREISWDFAIAPLEGGAFNDCKSDIKFLDYSILGIPGIYSRRPSYGNTVKQGQNGLLAESYQEWLDALDSMVLDDSLRNRLASQCSSEVWENRTLARHATKWADVIRRVLTARRKVHDSSRETRHFFSSNNNRFSAVIGRAEGSQLSREEKLLWCIDSTGIGLEVGPGYSPLLRKSEGFNVETLDHASAAELREKYSGMGVDIRQIEEVDYVWKGEPLDELIGKKGHYDFILASHVIEHTTDVVSFIQQCERMLKPEGVLSLAIPDCRFCFDIFRGASTTGDTLQAFIEKRKRHTPGVVFDHVSRAAFLNGKPSWHRSANGDLQFLHTFEQARDLYERCQRENTYFDVHNWRFTPSSFQLIVNDLRSLDFIRLGVAQLFDTEGYEFIVNLKPGNKPDLAERLMLARRAWEEMSEVRAPWK